jgi:putative Ca2+/H+ antiporter (TMEM165/GDT1 family)
MDWPIFTSTFLTIFLAELGDKTQFAAMAQAAQSRSTGSIILATITALALAGTLGVLFGTLLGKYLDPNMMKYVSGSAFVAVGLWILFK